MLVEGQPPEIAFAYLIWHITRSVIECGNDFVLLHAAAAELEGRVCIFPAVRESGKSTLVAALADSGMTYLGDELVALEPATLQIHPYPKPITLNEGSWTVLEKLKPQVASSVEPFVSLEWNIQPLKSRPTMPVATPELIVMPRYHPGKAAELEGLPRSRFLLRLVENSFNLGAHGAGGFRSLARLVRHCSCYQITFGNAGEAADLLVGLIEAGDLTVPAQMRRSK